LLEYPTARQDAIELVLEQLIGQVARQLSALGRGALRLECRLACQPGGESGTGPICRNGQTNLRSVPGAWHKSGLSRFLQFFRQRDDGKWFMHGMFE
jgi:hypothetical protein